jgi:hypothetical protein
VAQHRLVVGGEHACQIWINLAKILWTRTDPRCSKFKNFSRGGGRHFSRDLDPRNAARQINGESSSEEEDSDEEEESEDEAQGPASEPTLAPEMAALNLKLGNTVALDEPEVEMSRAERKAMKKSQATKKVQIQEPTESDSEGSEEVDDLLNPPKQAGKKQDVKPKAKAPAAPELSRKERCVVVDVEL